MALPGVPNIMTDRTHESNADRLDRLERERQQSQWAEEKSGKAEGAFVPPMVQKPKITAPFKRVSNRFKTFVVFDTDHIGSVEFMVNGKYYNAATAVEIDDTITLTLVERDDG